MFMTLNVRSQCLMCVCVCVDDRRILSPSFYMFLPNPGPNCTRPILVPSSTSCSTSSLHSLDILLSQKFVTRPTILRLISLGSRDDVRFGPTTILDFISFTKRNWWIKIYTLLFKKWIWLLVVFSMILMNLHTCHLFQYFRINN